MRYLCAAAIVLAAPAAAETMPSQEQLISAISTAMAAEGCKLDISDYRTSEERIAKGIGAALKLEDPNALVRDGPMWKEVDDAFQVLMTDGRLMVDREAKTVALKDCVPG